ncbi:hypothetical protein [Dysgonomonas sp.]|uniref:hypothetical protein n=1 Tax=Dysgonomonas sp. TaxID=1891233 RepID=UPI0027B89B3D|nr:hypothetical protein [Dysgonomonas sp.]
MEQIFISKEAKFYLRHNKRDKATTIFMMVRLCGKQFKLSTSVKVIPTQWNQREQIAYISHRLCELDNHNNEIVNSRLNVIKERYSDFIKHICENPQKALNCNELLRRYIYVDNMTKKTINLDIIPFLRKSIGTDVELREGTQRNYLKGVTALNAFLKFREANGEKAISSFKEFSTEFFWKMADYLPIYYKKDNGESYSRTTINDFLKLANIVVTKYGIKGGYLTVAEAKSIGYKQLTNNTSKDNEIYLRNDEILKLYRYQPSNELDEIVRDVFLLECLTGQRIQDTLRLDENIQEIMGVKQIIIVPKKVEKTKLKIHLLFDIAEKILIDKYNYQVPPCTKDQINHRIKRIAREAGINGTETISKHYGNNAQVTTTMLERYDCISSHTGRRTFVSLLVLRGWTYEKIKKYTGQSLKIVELYDKTSAADVEIFKKTPKEDIVMFINEHKDNNTPKIQLSQTNKQAPNGTDEITINQIIQKAKEVLTLLDVPPIEWINLNDIDELYHLIYKNEAQLEKIGFNRRLLKDIKKIHNLKEKYTILNKIKEQYIVTHTLIQQYMNEK